ncbi:MAG TPA: DUF2062 domain-containing protein [Vicinamibacterales bacterium]|nr:DUF2062 domain-containing protein [Vicinamibacterales bacterium]
MIHLTRAFVREWLDRLLHIADTPERTAAAFSLGVFFGFSPFLGLHTLLGILFAFLFNLNRVAVLLGVYSNLPWLLGPYYALATVLGARLTGNRLPHGFTTELRELFEHSLLQVEFWHRLGDMLKPLGMSFVVGSMLGAIMLAGLAYPLARGFIASRRRLKNILHHHHKQ